MRLTPAASPRFDPRAPLPDRPTLHRIRGSGVGQASRERLRRTAAGAAAVAAALLGVNRRLWWLALWPVALALFAAWGLTRKSLDDRALRRDTEPFPALLLRAVGALLAVGAASAALAGMVMLAAVAGRWEWAMLLVDG